VESTRFNTYKYYKTCNVLFFNELSGQSAGNFTKKLCKHLTSTKKTFNKWSKKTKLLKPLFNELRMKRKNILNQ
jgi:hypothetical protein